MNIERNLIFIKSEDKTEKITYCKYNNGKYDVTFSGNSRAYSYNYNNVRWLSKPEELNPERILIYENKQCITGIIKIFKFEDYFRLIFKSGFNKLYHKSQIVIEENCLNDNLSNDCFKYLKMLASYINVSLDEDRTFLSKQYEKLTNISPSSVLANYLNPKKINKIEKHQQVIFPFGFNISQKSATENALSSQISVIEGPPGTGKTQTILNIIANAIINDKTVAVVSNNNSATANVLEKLEKYDVDFIAAYLGKSENRKKFFESHQSDYPEFSQWKVEAEEYEEIQRELLASQKTLEEMLEKQNTVARLKQELSSLNTEIEYFNSYSNTNKSTIKSYKTFFNNNSNLVMSLMVDYHLRLDNNQAFDIKYKFRNLFKYGIFSFKFYKNSQEDIVEHLRKLYYELRFKEITKEISTIEALLNSYSFKEQMKAYSEKSMRLLKAKLAKKYGEKHSRVNFSEEALWKNFESFIYEYPVILSTTHSLRNSAAKNYLFDYVIIDEASQVDVVTGALAFSSAKNAVIVGDLKQLPNIVSSEIEVITNNIFNHYHLNEAYNYSKHSLLSSIVSLYDDVPKTLLKEHYRCHPKIIDFCNKKFYDDELIILTNGEENDAPLAVYKTVKGNHARGNYNQRQIDVILEEILPNLKSKKSIGIISPYRDQIAALQKVIEDENVEIDTVHKYQGREKKTIILSTVANESNDFIEDPNLINVAVSRAEDKLILIVSDSDIVNGNNNISDLIRYIDYNNFEIINSNIYSVFDLLYSSYSEKLLEMLNRNKKVSEHTSENLMNAVIEKVLSDDKFKSLDKVMHQPLKMLIRDTSKLNEAEYKFAMNILTHTDFLIYRKIDKMPVLVVEVDGYQYHANNPRQLERDRMKDEILDKYNIPILRLKTNESGEEKRIYDKLLEVLN
ncbi:AAA family ATPase [Clostridium sp. YIM B02505]|uniref:AAA family ATPase n=1 Tax=Clostridium yunnanense TaxID=2800325 RepID=A0ABS1EJE9_9CLOT|nr:AAA domain-containing protein [Clostridium yunnanense]MBK1809489.1 AAA family ATPase [Clostridium yunnanense]